MIVEIVQLLHKGLVIDYRMKNTGSKTLPTVYPSGLIEKQSLCAQIKRYVDARQHPIDNKNNTPKS